MCLYNMRKTIFVWAIVDASGKGDTMVGLFFVRRGSGPIHLFLDAVDKYLYFFSIGALVL